MAKKILTSSLEEWLYENYPHYDNQKLAEELSVKIRKEYDRKIVMMEQVLPDITQGSALKRFQDDISFMKSFESVDANFVRQVAFRLKCPHKDKVFLSECNRRKANIVKQNKWLAKARPLSGATKWFRTFRIREIRYIKVACAKEMKSIRVAITNWNKTEGPTYSYTLRTEFDADILVLRVQAKLLKFH